LREMYLRFIIGDELDEAKYLHGPFSELASLKKKSLLEDHELIVAEDVFEWFNENLPCPPWTDSEWGRDAISWFKDSANIFISKMFDIVAILEEHNIKVKVIKTKKLYRILYEDEYQVVAYDPKY
jgi:hypothetical protein